MSAPGLPFEISSCGRVKRANHEKGRVYLAIHIPTIIITWTIEINEQNVNQFLKN